MIKNNGPILVAHIGPLAIQRGRIVIRPEDIEKLIVADDRRIELHLHHFGVPGVVTADIFVGRILGCAAGISNGGFVTPGMARKVASTPQKQPAPNVAFSLLMVSP